jgi:hypothetical protein
MFGAAAPTGLTPLQLVEILGTATAIAIGVGAVYRRRLAKTRTGWRNADDVDGFRDARGWHPGVIDKVNGWSDEIGPHAGLYTRVEQLEEDHHTTRQMVVRHSGDPTAHSRGT